MFIVPHPSALSRDPLPCVDRGSEPTTVTKSRWPLALTRNTAKPVSSLWKVTRSIRPVVPSWGCCWIVAGIGKIVAENGSQTTVLVPLRSVASFEGYAMSAASGGVGLDLNR